MLLALSNFKCCQDLDIENFLHTNALNFLERGWCSVYLLLDEKAFLDNELKIEAYFTLSHKTLCVTSEMTKKIFIFCLFFWVSVSSLKTQNV